VSHTRPLRASCPIQAKLALLIGSACGWHRLYRVGDRVLASAARRHVDPQRVGYLGYPGSAAGLTGICSGQLSSYTQS
jgi:hypothetical protein